SCAAYACLHEVSLDLPPPTPGRYNDAFPHASLEHRHAADCPPYSRTRRRRPPDPRLLDPTPAPTPPRQAPQATSPSSGTLARLAHHPLDHLCPLPGRSPQVPRPRLGQQTPPLPPSRLRTDHP